MAGAIASAIRYLIRAILKGDKPLSQFWEGDNGVEKARSALGNLPIGLECQARRATGVTNFLQNGGSLEVAQRIAGHADSRTTKLYDRRAQQVLVEDMERIR